MDISLQPRSQSSVWSGNRRSVLSSIHRKELTNILFGGEGPWPSSSLWTSFSGQGVKIKTLAEAFRRSEMLRDGTTHVHLFADLRRMPHFVCAKKECWTICKEEPTLIDALGHGRCGSSRCEDCSQIAGSHLSKHPTEYGGRL